MKYTFDRVVRLVIGLAIATIIIILLNRLSSVILPFLIGWLLAYLINPLVNFLQNRAKIHNRIASIAIALILICGVLTGVVWALIPMIVGEIDKATLLINEYLKAGGTSTTLSGNIESYYTMLLNHINEQGWLNSDNIKNTLDKLLPQVWNLVSTTWKFLAGIFVIFIIFLYVIFILIDYEKITSGFHDMIPPKYKPLIEGIIEDVENGMNRYFRGQSLVALIVGILCAIGFKIVGLPLGITIGLFVGLLNLVPYLQTIAVIPVTLLALLQSAETGSSFWLIMLGCFIVFLVVQSVQDLILVPKIMGKAMGLNPAIILLSLSIGGSLLGIIGMIIALPATTILISYYKRFILHQSK